MTVNDSKYVFTVRYLEPTELNQSISERMYFPLNATLVTFDQAPIHRHVFMTYRYILSNIH